MPEGDDMQKPSQIGWTFMETTRAMHAAIVHGKTCIYTMPTDGDATKLVTGRLDRIIDASRYLRLMSGRERVSGQAHNRARTDNTEQKHLGRGIIYFDGTKGKSGALSIPADVLFHDEVDFSDPETLEMYQRRLNALPAEKREVHYFSTPTVAGLGINALYEASDAKQWLVKCPGCSWEGPLDYWTHTEGHRLELHCASCDTVLDPREGRWVAQHPDRTEDVHGYHVVRMMDALPNNPGFLKGLHDMRQHSVYTWHFENMDLGVTSEAGTSSINLELVKRRAFVEPYPKAPVYEQGRGRYYMGIDQGDTLTITVWRDEPGPDGGKLRLMWFARVRDPHKAEAAWAEAERLMTAFRIEVCVCDALPNSAKAHSLAQRFPGRVFCAYYKEGMRTEVASASDIERRAQGEQRRRMDNTERSDISIERTMSLDKTAEILQSGEVLLPSPVQDPEMQEFLKQLGANVSKPVLNSDGQATRRWEKTGPNDYFHSTNYGRVARDEGRRLSRMRGAAGPSPVIALGVDTRR